MGAQIPLGLVGHYKDFHSARYRGRLQSRAVTPPDLGFNRITLATVRRRNSRGLWAQAWRLQQAIAGIQQEMVVVWPKVAARASEKQYGQTEWTATGLLMRTTYYI